MKVRVLLFAHARDLVGTDSLDLALPSGATVRHLRETLAAQYPKLAPLMERCAVAVDHDYLSNDEIVPGEAVVAVIPPVSGGSGWTPLTMSSTDRSPDRPRKVRRKVRVKRETYVPDPDSSFPKRIDWLRVIVMMSGIVFLSIVAMTFLRAVLPRLEGQLH